MSVAPSERTRTRTVRTQSGQFAMLPAWVVGRVRRVCKSASEIATALHLYVTLGLYANRAKRAWPKTEQLAAALGPVDEKTGKVTPVGVRTIERSVFHLRRAGALYTEKRRNSHGHVMGLEYVLIQVDPNHAPMREAVRQQPAVGGELLGGESADENASAGRDQGNADYPPQEAGSDEGLTAAHGGLLEGLPACTGGDTPPQEAVRTPPHLVLTELDPFELDPRAAAAAEARVSAFVNAFNDALVLDRTTRIPGVYDITAKERKLIDRALTSASVDEWRLLFEQAVRSSFLSGKSKSGWYMTLWWLLGDDERVRKLYRGEYDDNFSDAERTAASHARFNALGGNRCPHSPTCIDDDACLKRWMLATRARRSA